MRAQTTEVEPPRSLVVECRPRAQSLAQQPNCGGERAHNAEQRWEDQFGHVNVLVVTCVAYAAREQGASI